MIRNVSYPEFVRGESVELAMNEDIGGRNAVQALHLRRRESPAILAWLISMATSRSLTRTPIPRVSSACTRLGRDREQQCEYEGK
jgi:hypothetical protein